MADQELWRKNLPKDFQGKMGEHWDDEISIKPIYWTAAAIAGAVAVAFVLCWFLMMGPLDYFPEKYMGFKTELSPLEEANARRLPPTPWLQPKPEMEMDAWHEEMLEQTTTYGWTDELNGVVRIPVDRAIGLVADSLQVAPATVEPTEEQPMDVEPATYGEDAGGTPPAAVGNVETYEQEQGDAAGGAQG